MPYAFPERATLERALLAVARASPHRPRTCRAGPVNLEHPEQLAEIVAQLTVLRQEAGEDPAEPYDVVAALPPGGDPAPYAAPGPRGGSWTSRRMRYRWIRCAG